MTDTPEVLTPTRMATRNTSRVNYMEMSQGGSDDAFANNDDAVFRSPAAGTRGRKRRVAHDVSDLTLSFSNMAQSPSKRGRPRQSMTGIARPKTTRDEAQEAKDSTLYAAVKSGKAIPDVVENWIERYEENYQLAINELHQFFIAICGCRGVLTPQMSATMDYADIIRRMTEDFDEESGDYPLVQSGPTFKKFRQNLHTMIHTLIDKCKSSLMFDNRLMDGIIQLLTGLADSQVRAFRHTATYAAMKISSALVDVVIDLTSVKEKNSKQIETERVRVKQNATNNEKLDALLLKKSEIEEKTDEVRQMLQYLFKSVFVHRYRDGLPDIRSICISELGNWMQVYPEHFLEDSYLKYIGWTLYDKFADVRLKCIRSLMPLYKKAVALAKLELFTNKFKERLVSMVLDKDQEVAVESCNLMTLIYTVFPTLLTVQDCVPIYELVYCNHRTLAVAAGEFLNTKVFQNAKKGGKTADANNAALIKDLIQFYIEGECHDHATYIVDALIDTNYIIKDWATMIDLLLGKTLSDKAELNLIEILACSVKQSATGESPVGRSVAKRGAPALKETREQTDDRVRLSEILIPALPALLRKFVADREKVINLVTIPVYFHLDMYLVARMQNNLVDLLQLLEVIVEKHVDDDLLNGVAEVYYTLSMHQTVAAQTEAAKMKMIDGIALQFQRSATRLLNNNTMDDEDETNLLCSIRRIKAFSRYMDLRKWDLWDLALKIVVNYDKNETATDVTEAAILILFMQLNFDLYRLVKEGESGKGDNVKKLRKRRDQLLRNLENTIQYRASGVEQAFLALCDSFILFGPQLETHSQKVNLESLIVRPEDNIIKEIHMFLKLNAFSDDSTTTAKLSQQQQIELMHKKRKLVTQFCKLIIHGVLPIKESTAVLQYYVSNYTDFGDIFKNLLFKCRDLDFKETGLAVAKTLRCVFENLLAEFNGTVDPLSETFIDLRDLAKRFASSFGNDYRKNRYGVAMMHKESIDFAFENYDPESNKPPPNLLFLEVAMEFSSKLIAQDKNAIVDYLEKKSTLPIQASTKDTEWDAYNLYKNSLKEKDAMDDTSSVRSFSTVTSFRSTASRGRGRGRGSHRAVPFF
ncbi:unnamed protein product [Caenorhabditis auriculariae]|uniref:SCD domain-containing protein n=1 Tax=Caenorhabditis auriculariae TaxID=2777116 RepID=A0A8S1GVC5_9PELO|nr:unnamed protein product [Caenorhabditis auriculariae]